MSKQTDTKLVVGIIAAAIAAGGSGYGVSAWSSGGVETKIAAMETRLAVMDNNLQRLIDDQTDNERRDKTLTKHWKLHTWSKDEINKLRVEHAMPLSSWPDLD